MEGCSQESGHLSGWHSSTNKLESVLVEDIVNDVVKKLNVLSSNDTTGSVGLDSKVKEIESLLCIGTDGVRRVGIWGSGGIGKTTLTEAVISKISHQFEGSYFIDNIRELLEQRGGLNHLGRKLVSTILGDENGNIGTFFRGHNFTRNRLSRKNILICFDDVNDFRQIEILIESLCNSLGSRSRAIITATFVSSNHVSVKSIILPFDLQKLLCYENEVTFEFCLHSSSLKIEKCGVHLMFGEKVDGSSWVGKDEDVLSLANVHDNCEEVNEPQKIDGDTQLIKMVKALCVLSLGLQVYLKEVFLLDSVGYLSVNCLDLAWWTCPRRSC